MQVLRRISASLRGLWCNALALFLIWIPLSIGAAAHAQTSAAQPEYGSEALSPAAAVIPQQVRYAGKLANRTGQTVDVIFRIYAVQQDGEPLWTETQRLTVGEDGSYSVLLGSADPRGLPQAVFAGGAARWLGVSVEGAPETERVLLASVPYAMKSADAEALAGHAATDFVTQAQLSQLEAQRAQAPAAAPAFTSGNSGTVTGGGTAGTIPMWTGTQTQGNSDMVQVGNDIGIHEATPAATLDVGGTGMIRGLLTLPAVGTATTSAGADSQILQFDASAWSTTASGAVTPTFRMYANPTSNDTANPGASFRFQYQLGATTTTVLSFGSNGALITNGGLTMTPVAAATSAAGVNSPALELGASAYSSGSSSAVAQNFVWQVLPIGNDTATPSGDLALLYASGTHTPAATGLSISPNGVVNWAPGQTFGGAGGGTITGITTSSPLTGSGTSGSVALGLNQSALVTDITPSLESTFDSRYALLSGGNTFSSYIEAQQSFGTGYAALYGLGSNGSIGTYGDSDSGYGIEGGTNSGTGVFGVSSTGNGVEGAADSGTGVYGTSNSGYGVYGSSPNNYAVIGVTTSGNGVYGQVATAPQAGVVGRQLDSSGNWGIYSFGNIGATGTKSSVVPVDNGTRQVALYAVESPGVWFEDYGSSQLVSGVAFIAIDPGYAETVNTSVEYHVFLTPDGDCEGLYVTAKTATGFEVRELHQGTSNVAFDYRIIALRRGYETTRLADVTKATPRTPAMAPRLAPARSAAGTASEQ